MEFLQRMWRLQNVWWSESSTKQRIVASVSSCIGIAAIIGAYGWFRYLKPALLPQNPSHWKSLPSNIVIMYQFHRWEYTPNPSPFCIKLEAYLRYNNIPFVTSTKYFGQPKGKLPYITHKGKTIADTEIIINYLNKEYNIDMDKHLTDIQLSQKHIVRKMIEESIYFETLYIRWKIDNIFDKYSKRLFDPYNCPFWITTIVKYFTRRHIKDIQLYEQGTGRHDKKYVIKMLKDDCKSIGTLLGNNTYFFGDHISSIDFVIFAFLCGIYWVPFYEKFNWPCYEQINEYLKRVNKIVWKDNSNWKTQKINV
eukprot:102028_1